MAATVAAGALASPATAASGLASTSVSSSPTTLNSASHALGASDLDALARKGKLDWGVKESFREYIEGPIAQGHIDVFKPATRNADGTFDYPKGKGSVDGKSADVAFKGRVFFTGHDGALELWVSTPRVVIDGDDGTVVVDTTTRSASGTITTAQSVEFATLDLTGVDLTPNGKGVLKVKNLPATLTEDGASYFGGFYAAGTELDPVTFKVKVG